MNTQKTEQGIVFDSIKIGLASPEKIREWSRGEVRKPETINYRTLKPEKDGLFCEKIFGPTKDWECHCGKYKRIRYKGVVCDRCGVEVTKAKVRRERMGHIELAAPVSHIWYFKGIPSRMGLILAMSPRALEKILYFASYVVLNPGKTELQYKQLLSEREYREAYDKFGNTFEAAMGAEAVKRLLMDIDLEKESVELKRDLVNTAGQKRVRIIKKLEVIESFRISGNKPEWMILDVVPVIPPDIRPMVQLDGGRFATSDLNDLYRRVINRNNRLKRLLDLGAPDIIVRNEKRMLQEAVDALIDNGRRGRPVTGPGNRALKSLSDMLKGKQGRFRQNLLGKRVDYSGRSVIVVGPELKIFQCGLPKEMAIELFKPFVMKKLVEDGLAHNIKSAKRMVERLQTEVWDILEDVIKEHPVMLNRAPTLHRLGIQAFEPVLVEGRAIKLHPLVCTAYNADFDGDQMAVHVPLSVEAQAECRFLLLSPNNLLKPSDGAPVTVPSQDMILGMYYLTLEREDLNSRYEEDLLDEQGNVVKAKGDLVMKPFKDEKEAMLAYDNHEIALHEAIRVKRVLTFGGVKEVRMVRTTVGRIIFNEAIPQNLGYVDRTSEEEKFRYEIDFLVDKKQIGKIINRCINRCGSTETAAVLDKIKSLGYKFSTRAALTVSVSDMEIPKEKPGFLAEAEEKVELITRKFRRGLMTDEERHNKVIEAWNTANEKITIALLAGLGKYNNIYMMANSGARGSNSQIKQLAGMRGLMANPSGGIIELPIKSNFREGLSVLEYFISAHGARKGLTDTALRTADSGYLTRRLVDVSQDIIIREWDCCEGSDQEAHGLWVAAFMDGNEVIEGLQERIRGRWSVLNVIHPTTGEIIVPADTMITFDQAEKVEKAGIKKVLIRTVLTCRSNVGICAKCYGANMASGRYVRIGESVGIIAAQSIGEPGTQLTMRTFHTGGIAGDDITQGLPRVEELFEARKPKGLAIIAEFAGRVTLNDTKKKREVVITSPETAEVKDYLIPYGSRIKVYDGDMVEAGDEITEGSVNPHDILKIKGLRGVQDYMIQEVQRVYRLQGVEIN
ncbi:MAG: DNA-directed RNA polymerase subunit beta', partial [Anaerotignum sp.]|nr:DNA-directed RNA polymerase subunit beta' [Anaerotignum sp.]